MSEDAESQTDADGTVVGHDAKVHNREDGMFVEVFGVEAEVVFRPWDNLFAFQWEDDEGAEHRLPFDPGFFDVFADLEPDDCRVLDEK